MPFAPQDIYVESQVGSMATYLNSQSEPFGNLKVFTSGDLLTGGAFDAGKAATALSQVTAGTDICAVDFLTDVDLADIPATVALLQSVADGIHAIDSNHVVGFVGIAPAGASASYALPLKQQARNPASDFAYPADIDLHRFNVYRNDPTLVLRVDAWADLSYRYAKQLSAFADVLIPYLPPLPQPAGTDSVSWEHRATNYIRTIIDWVLRGKYRETDVIDMPIICRLHVHKDGGGSWRLNYGLANLARTMGFAVHEQIIDGFCVAESTGEPTSTEAQKIVDFYVAVR